MSGKRNGKIVNMKNEEKVENIRLLAQVYGWQLMWHRELTGELYFRKAGCQLTIWYSTMTVRTALKHPTKGKTQMFRKRISMELLERIMTNPRIHTNKGYIQKNDGNYQRWY